MYTCGFLPGIFELQKRVVFLPFYKKKFWLSEMIVFQGAVNVAKLLNVSYRRHIPLGTKNARICQHYKISLTAVFDMYPVSMYIELCKNGVQNVVI